MIIEKFIIITNNTLSQDNLKKEYDVELLGIASLDLLYRVKDFIHSGYS